MLKIITLLGLSSLALFADDSKGSINMEAMIMFFAFIIGTMGITKWAASKTKSASDFYTAGGGITGFQNGLAIAGDYMSAASLSVTNWIDCFPRCVPDRMSASFPKPVALPSPIRARIWWRWRSRKTFASFR